MKYGKPSLQFEDELHKDLLLGVPVTSGIIAFAHVFFIGADLGFKDADFQFLVTYRIAMAVFYLGIVGLSLTGWGKKVWPTKVLGMVSIGLCGISVSLLTTWTGGSKSFYWTMIILTYFGGVLLLRFTPKEILVPYLAILVFHTLNMIFYAGDDPKGPEFITDIFGIVLALIVSIISNWYIIHLKKLEFEARKDLEAEKHKSETLLLNILPDPIAKRMLSGENKIADYFDDISVLFGDIQGFTILTRMMNPHELVNILNRIFTRFDDLAGQLGLEKIKTIGDAYMVAGGIPNYVPDHARRCFSMAVGMNQILDNENFYLHHPFKIRIGIATGPVVAGVIGQSKFIYDLWGDTVNTASRLESTGVAGEIQVTQTTLDLIRDIVDFVPRGEIELKGIGMMQTFLARPKLEFLTEIRTFLDLKKQNVA